MTVSSYALGPHVFFHCLDPVAQKHAFSPTKHWWLQKSAAKKEDIGVCFSRGLHLQDDQGTERGNALHNARSVIPSPLEPRTCEHGPFYSLHLVNESLEALNTTKDAHEQNAKRCNVQTPWIEHGTF